MEPMNRFLMVVYAGLMIGLMYASTGCSLDDSSDNSGESASAAGEGAESSALSTPAYTDLPNNPSIPANPSGTSRQLWYFGYKSYDNTFRIRWPTHFATSMGVGPGSYTMVDGQRASFRSFDTDYGAKRPSYTIRGPKNRFRGDVLCILYSEDGRALGWFVANADVTSQGRLP